MSISEHLVRVYYEDTDAGGVVYHARYLHFFERARTELLRSLGFEQQNLFQEYQLAFVVKKMDIDFVKAAKLDDKLVVKTKIAKIKRASIIFEQFLYRDETLLVTCEVLVASVDLQVFKPVAMPKSINKLLDQQL